MFRQRPGFALTESLVTLVIIAAIIFAFMPAVQAAQEAGLRAPVRSHVVPVDAVASIGHTTTVAASQDAFHLFRPEFHWGEELFKPSSAATENLTSSNAN